MVLITGRPSDAILDEAGGSGSPTPFPAEDRLMSKPMPTLQSLREELRRSAEEHTERQERLIARFLDQSLGAAAPQQGRPPVVAGAEVTATPKAFDDHVDTPTHPPTNTPAHPHAERDSGRGFDQGRPSIMRPLGQRADSASSPGAPSRGGVTTRQGTFTLNDPRLRLIGLEDDIEQQHLDRLRRQLENMIPERCHRFIGVFKLGHIDGPKREGRLARFVESPVFHSLSILVTIAYALFTWMYTNAD